MITINHQMPCPEKLKVFSLCVVMLVQFDDYISRPLLAVIKTRQNIQLIEFLWTQW